MALGASPPTRQPHSCTLFEQARGQQLGTLSASLHHMRAGLYCKMDLVIDLLKRCPELRRAALPHDQPGDTYELPFGATLARCTQLATLRLFTNGEHVSSQAAESR